ncbi:MAG: ABC transporter substrate-binding protein [Psychromonas sp.]
MFNKLVIAISLLLLLIIAIFVYWLPAAESKNMPQTSGLPIKVARYYWPGQYWIEIADKKGWFKTAGLNVELVDTNPNYYGSLQDMVAGKIDVNNFTLFDLMDFNAAGADLVLAINSDNSTGIEAIVARQTIATIEELKGKRIGVDIGSYLEYILDVVLKRHGLMPGDINKVQLAAEEAAEEFGKGKLDAIVTWEPFVSEVIEMRHGQKLFDTSEIPGISPNGQAFQRSFIEQRPEDVQAYVNVWYKTMQFIKLNPQQAYAIIADIYNVTENEVKAFAQLDQIMDLRDNMASFSYGAGFESLHGSARYINNFLIEKGHIKKPMDSTEFIDPTFIRTLTHTLQQEAL